jgi:hypothetical protein
MPLAQVEGDLVVLHPLVPPGERRPTGVLDDGFLVVLAGEADSPGKNGRPLPTQR